MNHPQHHPKWLIETSQSGALVFNRSLPRDSPFPVYPGFMVLGVLVKSFWRNSDNTCKPLSATWTHQAQGLAVLEAKELWTNHPQNFPKQKWLILNKNSD